jgi:hypothetical protein
MMSGVLLIFGLPMIVAAILISPSALHNLMHGVLLYAILGLLLPLVGWRTFLIEFALPRSAESRLAAVIRLWLVCTVMVACVINLAIAVLDYSPMRPGPNPTAGFLVAGFVLCMFVSSGVWGALAPIVPRDVAVRGALATGVLLFVAVTTLGYLVSRIRGTATRSRLPMGSQKPVREPVGAHSAPDPTFPTPTLSPISGLARKGRVAGQLWGTLE